MRSKRSLIAVLVLICALGGALLYATAADRDALPAVSGSHEQPGTSTTTAHGTGRDPLNCHSHGATAYHCH